MMKYTVLSLLLLAGCMVGPNYRKPEIAMPAEFLEGKGETEGSESNLCGWWKQFNDPLLDELIAQAASANFDWRIALEQIIEARAQYKVQRSKLFPEIDLNAAAIRSRNSQNFFNPSSTELLSTSAPSTNPALASASSGISTYQDFFQVGFDAIWELDFFGKFRRAKNAAYDSWEASRDEAQAVLILALSEVARSYVEIRGFQQKIKLTCEKIRADEEELALTQALFAAGLDSEIDVEGLIATLESDRAALPLLETGLKQTIFALAVLLGQLPEPLVARFNEIGPIPSGMDKVPIGLPSDLLRRRPDVRSAERQLAAATEMIGYAVADLFPHISLTGTGYGYESAMRTNWLTPPSRYWNIGPIINWDLIDFGRTRGQIAIQNSLQRQALLSYEKSVIAALQDVEGALIAYFEEQKRSGFLGEQVGADERALQLNEDLYRSGLANEIQVLEARKTLIDAQNTLVDSQQSLASDLIALYKALGGDWECCSMP